MRHRDLGVFQHVVARGAIADRRAKFPIDPVSDTSRSPKLTGVDIDAADLVRERNDLVVPHFRQRDGELIARDARPGYPAP